MRKLILMAFSTLVLVSCSLEDDGPDRLYEYAEVTDVVLPDSFEQGETYDMEVTFQLPSPCHDFYDFEAHPGTHNTDEEREFYVGAITSYDAHLNGCNEDSEDLSRTRSLEATITGEPGTVYTFHFWAGEDSLGQSKYLTRQVTVADPNGTGGEGEEGTGSS